MQNHSYNFQRFWQGMFPLNAKVRLMTMLKTYIDASGSDGKSAYLIACGYLAELDRWTAFESEWKVLMASEGIEAFHMTDLMALKGEFEGWIKEHQENFLREVFGIIKRNTIAATTGIVNIADCQEYFPIPETPKKRKAENRTAFSKEYAVAALACVIGFSRVARRAGFSEPILHVFEAGDNGAIELAGALAYSRTSKAEQKRYLIGGFASVGKEDNLPLCCADVLANQVRAEAQTIGSVTEVAFERHPLADLVRPQDRWVYAFDKRNLPALKSLGDLIYREV